ncbi:hypothetical protein [Absidia glauca]|uniref:Uncharacterized protein n=1 Tax=Absidia glauca TaxID=4829 RepID=A0A163JVA8_ABSGL|nr:hypothetical protein [Absidia glauca]
MPRMPTSHNEDLMTRGQASCLVLDLVPTIANRQTANDIVDSGSFAVIYTDEHGPRHPFAMGKSIVQKNPFTYKSYPRTPLASPQLSPDDTMADVVLEDSSNDDNDSDSSTENSNTYSSQNLLTITKAMFVKETENEELFDLGFYTTTDIYDSIGNELPNLPDYISVTRFGRLLKDNDFGRRVSTRVNGRMSYQAHKGSINDYRSVLYRSYISHNVPSYI